MLTEREFGGILKNIEEAEFELVNWDNFGNSDLHYALWKCEPATTCTEYCAHRRVSGTMSIVGS